jgi:peptide chain release factor 2
MLLRMYARWAEKHGYKVELDRGKPGRRGGHQVDDAADQGPQRLWLAEDRIRRPPPGAHLALRFSNARRHTSFASAWVYPVIDDSIEIEIEDKDLRIDTYRASGAGGQHVNTDRLGRAHHPRTDRHRRAVPERPLAAQEPRPGHGPC